MYVYIYIYVYIYMYMRPNSCSMSALGRKSGLPLSAARASGTASRVRLGENMCMYMCVYIYIYICVYMGTP